jgi:hypothetical protein
VDEAEDEDKPEIEHENKNEHTNKNRNQIDKDNEIDDNNILLSKEKNSTLQEDSNEDNQEIDNFVHRERYYVH